MRYEHHSQPLLSRTQFTRRVINHWLVAFVIIAGSLGIGMLGYHYIEGFPWIDALLNAAMLLGGMGPVNTLATHGGKLFASFYALFSGMVFLVVAGIMVAPIAHRILHRLHLDTDDTPTG